MFLISYEASLRRLVSSYLGIYFLKKKETKKQTKTRQKTGKKRKKKKKIRYSVGLEPSTFRLTQPYLTTTPLRLITYVRGKDFNLMPFVWHFRQQTAPFKDDRAALTKLLTVKKKNNVNAYSMAVNEWKNIIMLNKTPIQVLVCKVGLLDFHCYVQANGQNHIHFWLIQVLRIAWHDIFSLSHHLLASRNLYIRCVAEGKSKFSSSRQV